MREPHRKAGRKPIQIELVELEKLCSLHCTDQELADWFRSLDANHGESAQAR
jgi:hypothetical protein